MARFCITLMLLVCLGSTAFAQELPILGRTVARFDFEERTGQNRHFSDMPRHWSRVHDSRFHRHTQIKLTESGQGLNLMMRLKGGSAAIELNKGILPAIPNTLYRIHGRIRAESGQLPAPHKTKRPMQARARISAVFYSAEKGELGETWIHSPLVSDRGLDGREGKPLSQWHRVWFDLPLAPPKADWILLRLELLQPSVYRQTSRPLNIDDKTDPDQHLPNAQDLHASAWFDDIQIDRKPVLDLRTQDPTNLVRHQVPVLNITARDPVGAKKETVVQIFNVQGQPVRIYDEQGRLKHEAIQRRPLGRQDPAKWQWPILADAKHPHGTHLPYGFYTATLTVLADGKPVSSAQTAFGYLPPLRSSADNRFAIVAEDLNESQRRLLEPLMDRLPRQVLVINAWSEKTTEREMQSDAWGQSLRRLMLKGPRIELSLPSAPKFLADRAGTDTDKMLAFFKADPAIWEPAMGLLLARYGHRVNRWHVGRSDALAEGFNRNDLKDIYGQIEKTMDRYIANPQIVLPWSAQKQLNTESGAQHFMVHIPTSIRPDRLPAASASWPKQAKITTLLQTYPAQGRPHVQPQDRATDLALRMVYAKVAHSRNTSIERMAIDRPWTHRTDYNGNLRLEPDPLLVVWDNLTNRLGGRKMVGSLKLGPNRTAHILEGPDGRGALVAWSNGGATASLSMNMGEGVRPHAVDIWGNRHDQLGKPYLYQQKGIHTLTLGPTPIFIEQVELPLMKLRAAFALSPDRAEAKHAAHKHQLNIHNPWPHTLSGSLRIVDPPHWKIEPRLQQISIPAGKTVALPLTITFPTNEPIGTKTIRAELEFESSQPIEDPDQPVARTRRRITLDTPLTIALKGYDLQTRLVLEGKDAVIRMTASREPDATIKDQPSFYLFVAIPGRPLHQGLISRFTTGDVRHRAYRIPNALPALSGQRILVGLRQIRGPALLNTVVEIP